MKKQTKVVLIMLLAGGIIFSGCGQEEKSQATSPSAMTAAVAPDAVVARVEGTVITGQVFNQNLDALMRQYGAQVPPEQLQQLQPMFRQQVVQALINQELLRQEAEREGVEPNEEDIDSQIEEFAAQVGGQAALESQMGMQGVTMDALRENVRRQLKIRQLIDAQLPEELEATEEEITEFYSANPDQFDQPEMVEASHILIQVEPGEDEEAKAAKLEEIEALKVRIEGGEDFSEVARESSQDQGTRERGGSLGYFGKGQMIPEFEEVAFALGTGEMSDVVETQFGYHLIKVTGKRDAGTVALEEVSEDIGQFLSDQKRQQIIADYLQKLREGIDIEYGPGFQPVPPPPSGPAQFPPARPPQN